MVHKDLFEQTDFVLETKTDNAYYATTVVVLSSAK